MRRVDWKDVLVGAALFCVVPVGAVAVYWNGLFAPKREAVFSAEMSIRELAKRNGIPAKEIVHHLAHDNREAWNWSRWEPVSSLPVDPDAVRHALVHAVEEETPGRDLLRFSLWGAYLAACLALLVFRKGIGRLRTYALLGAVVVFGVLLGSTPNPMEAVVKTFKAMRGMEADPVSKVVILGLFSVMAIVGSKLICGWGCQLGILQDSIHRLSPFKKIKRWQVPFWLANGVRVVLFLLFLDLLFGGLLGTENFVIYHHVNFFKLYRWELAPLALILLPVLALLSLVVYRPFCQFVCPFGLFSWALENLSLYRIHVDETLCTSCNKCVKACPTQAMKARMNHRGSILLPDCWACGACVDACPENAVSFDRRSRPPPATATVARLDDGRRKSGSIEGSAWLDRPSGRAHGNTRDGQATSAYPSAAHPWGCSTIRSGAKCEMRAMAGHTTGTRDGA
ncbi:MAG: 4Fe-4S binding protein [Planctomycetota bacterium]|jgi:ferredoxin